MPAPSNINIFWGKGSPQGLPFFGAVVRFDESGKLGCGLFGCLPSQSFASQMPALPRGEPRSRCECVCSYAQSKLVSPFGRDVAQRQRGLESAGMAFQICPDTGFFILRANKNRASFDTLSLGGRWWIRFSAEKPRRLQHASSMLPRAGFRIHCSYSQS